MSDRHEPRAFRAISPWDLLPLASFAAMNGLFAWGYERLPERIPVHWGPDGVPDRLVGRTGLLAELTALGVGVWLMLWSMSAALRWLLKEEATPMLIVLEPIRACVSAGMLLIGTSLIAQALFGVAYLGAGIALSILFDFLGIVAAILLVSDRSAADRPPALSAFRGRRWGLYWASDDPRLVVPRLGGFTFNFAHRRAWGALAAILLIPIAFSALMALVITLAR